MPTELHYFLVWPNGIHHIEQILSIIRAEESLKILYIHRFTSISIFNVLSEVYKTDPVNIWHLFRKSMHLFFLPCEFFVIFVTSPANSSLYFGEKIPFRVSQSLPIKEIKTKIREAFNPRFRQNDHVIHSSDITNQAYDFAKYLNIPIGDYVRSESNDHLFPPYLSKQSKSFELSYVNLDKLYARIIVGKDWRNFRIVETKLSDTPQYMSLINNDKSIYSHYITKFRGGPLKVDYDCNRFSSLQKSQRLIYEDKGLNGFSPLIVQLSSSGSFIILDGLHRASIRKHIGVKSSPALIVNI